MSSMSLQTHSDAIRQAFEFLKDGAVPPHPERLKNYTRAKQDIAYEIRSLREFLGRNFGEREAEECRELMAKLAEDRFMLAVVGEFKRGKSSLINAVIGRDLLPTGVLPLTSAITVLKYGPKEKLTIHWEQFHPPRRVPLESLAEYVTEKGNPGNEKIVARACLELPLPFFRGGLEFVDTPGIGSAIEANTLTTVGFLPKSDAVIFVTSVDSPLSGAEADFLKRIREHVRKVFFAVNKVDLVGDAEREEILRFIAGALEHQTGAEKIRLFPVSSFLGLKAKQAGSRVEYESSGLGSLEAALSDFLANEKASTFLVAILDKLSRLLTRTSQQVQLTRLAWDASHEELRPKLAELEKRLTILGEKRKDRLAEVHGRIVRGMKEIRSTRIAAFLEEQTRKFDGELNGSLKNSFWTPSFLSAARCVESVLPRLREDFLKWTSEEVQHLNPQFHQMIQIEWTNLQPLLRLIPEEASRVLGAPYEADSQLDSDLEVPIAGVLHRPGSIQVEWEAKVPLLQAFLPVGVFRIWLRKKLHAQLVDCLTSTLNQVTRAYDWSMEEAMKRLAAEVDVRAEALASRIVQALKGRTLSKGIDGRWRVTELDEAQLAHQSEELAAIERRLNALSDNLLQPASLTSRQTAGDATDALSAPVAAAPPDTSVSTSLEQASPMSEVNAALDLQTRGCPVCDNMIRAASEFFARRQYDLATQEKAQRSHAASLGFCPLHTWQLSTLASPHGLSKGYPMLMERLTLELSSLGARSGTDLGKAILALVVDSNGCEVCHLIKETETSSLETIISLLRTTEGQRTYSSSQGPCLRHLGMLVKNLTSDETISFLLAEAGRHFSEIAEDMRNYALKRDARQGYALNQDEQDAWLRGLIHSVGARRVCFPWDVEA